MIMRFTMNYDNLLDELRHSNKNIFIFGLGGSGKTEIIKKFLKNRDDVIVTAPSGIAAQNIGGRTIQSFFSIAYYTYEYNEREINIIEEKQEQIKKASVLLVDEVFLLRCDIIDIVDNKLRKIRNNNNPFGGLRLVLIGDPYQMEPVVQFCDRGKLREVYPCNNDDYFFYNSYVMKEYDLLSNFSLYELKHDFRHKKDPDFQKILNGLRNGYITEDNLTMLNSRKANSFFLNNAYQYLSVTRASSHRTNNLFLGRLMGNEYISEPVIDSFFDDGEAYKEAEKKANNISIPLKLDMKVVFVKNDPYSNGNRWYNGTIGYIKEINGNEKTKTVNSVLVKIDKNEDEYHEVFPVIDDIYSPYKKNKIGTLTQFPFISAFSITIDKSQGLTLDKIYLMLDSQLRNNQLYVALSRARSLNDVVLSREILREDIKVSSNALCFYNRIKGRLIPVFYEKEVSIINNITCNLNVNINGNIIRNIA
jgi:hypothetical protein